MPAGRHTSHTLELQPRDRALFRDLFESRLYSLRHITALYFDGKYEAAKKRIGAGGNGSGGATKAAVTGGGRRVMSEIDRDVIKCVLMGVDDAKIRYLFVERYSAQLEQFLDHMAAAFAEWHKLDADISKDLPGAHVSALVYGAFHTHVVAMKLLISGLLVPAGNSQRYVLESLATAMLVSKPDLRFLKLYMEEKYSTTKAVKDMRQHAGALNLDQKALDMLDSQLELYNLSSHPSTRPCSCLEDASMRARHSFMKRRSHPAPALLQSSPTLFMALGETTAARHNKPF